MSLTKSALSKSDRKKGIQSIQKKVVRGERRPSSHRSLPYEKTKLENGQMQIIHCKTCYYSQAIAIRQSKSLVFNKCPECMSKNLGYLSTSTSRLLQYILSNIH